MLILRPPFEQAWKDKDPFEEILHLDGEKYRSVKTRETSQFDFAGQSFFIKCHFGTTIKEIIKNILTLKMPVLGAEQEWNAIHHLQKVGVDTMEGVAFGKKGWNPLTTTSFLITRDLSPIVELNIFLTSEAGKKLPYSWRLAIIERLASTVKKMHDSGLNHRDCYLCHFLLHTPFNKIEDLKISVIDLHRAQIRPQVPRRWRDKDLIALYYSSLGILSRKEVFRFMKIYFNLPLREIFKIEKRLIRSATAKVEKIHSHTLKLGANR